MRYLFIILLVASITTNAQVIRLEDARTHEPITDALLISGNKHLGTTDATGTYKLQPQSENTNVCIKVFGYRDTCVRIGRENVVIHLKPIAFETQEVSVEGKGYTPKEQFLKYLAYSITLCNQEEEDRSYDYWIESRPDSTDLFDRMEGTFSYTHPSVKKRTHYRDLYACTSIHSISKDLWIDSLTRNSMDQGTLPYAFMHLNHLSSQHIKPYKRRFGDYELMRTITDSSVVFTLIDSTWYPSQYTWTFDTSGRLMKKDFIQILEEANRNILRSLGKRYIHQTYTNSGFLRIEHVDVIQRYTSDTGMNYTVSVKMDLLHNYDHCTNKEKRYIPIGLGISAWAKMHALPTVVIEE
jgi:hypothetical protein